MSLHVITLRVIVGRSQEALSVFVAAWMGASCLGRGELPASAQEEERTVLPRIPLDGDAPLSSFAVWQGWSMQWEYNHRLNRTGSLLEQLPCRASERTSSLRCRARIIATAASGTGTDEAALQSQYALAAARGVFAASAVKEILLQGPEGEALSARAEITIALEADAARRSRHVALLSGFDVAALGSADKLQRFGIRVGRSQVVGNEARVEIVAEGSFDCTSPECPAVDEVSMSMLVGVLHLSADPSQLSVHHRELTHGYAWDGRVEMPRELAVAQALLDYQESPSAEVWGIRGFEVRVDAEMHVAELGLQIGGDLQEGKEVMLLVKNWKEKMKGSRPPMSWFAFKQAGRADWSADLVRLGFRSGSVDRQSWQTRLAWAGKGTPALAPEGERIRMVRWEVSP